MSPFEIEPLLRGKLRMAEAGRLTDGAFFVFRGGREDTIA